MAKIVHIAHSHDGKILAASESRNPPRPTHVQGVVLGEFEVPTKFVDRRINEYIPLLMVDVKAHCLKEGRL
jgi:hypothetical protein